MTRVSKTAKVAARHVNMQSALRNGRSMIERTGENIIVNQGVWAGMMATWFRATRNWAMPSKVGWIVTVGLLQSELAVWYANGPLVWCRGLSFNRHSQLISLSLPVGAHHVFPPLSYLCGCNRII
jgi:hypothetical protein